ncbi:PfkB family carbohydrate kinase [Microbacterium sp. Se5.02b]|uniref:PfkB family carbohydrate kinase n=1 Tax=Microbacterium sp. Se5.02b TaxID=2864103 RepID=UPI00215DC0B1|nr:PfkB family carbohydrate kinase [Microbacterium sp. Se5.02b]
MNSSSSLRTAPEIVCIGETMALITPTDARLASAAQASIGLAGAESNVSAGVASTGHRVAWASRLGGDPLGDRVASELERRGVELWVERDDAAPTGVMFRTPGSSPPPSTTTVGDRRPPAWSRDS